MILGGLFLFIGLLVGLSVWLLPMDQCIEMLRSQGYQSGEFPGFTDAGFARLYFTTYGSIVLILGLILLGMTPFISRGGKWSSRLSIVLCCSIGVVVLFSVLGALLELGNDPARAALALFMSGGIFTLVTFTVMKLLIALKVSRKIAMLQWMQYQQMMQQSLTNDVQSAVAAVGYHRMPAQPILPDNPAASPMLPPTYPSQSPPGA